MSLILDEREFVEFLFLNSEIENKERTNIKELVIKNQALVNQVMNNLIKDLETVENGIKRDNATKKDFTAFYFSLFWSGFAFGIKYCDKENTIKK